MEGANLHANMDEANMHNSKGFSVASSGFSPWRNENAQEIWESRNILPSALSVAVSSLVPPTEVNGDIYLLDNTTPHANWDGCLQNTWVRFSSITGVWASVTPIESVMCYNKNKNNFYIYKSSRWVPFEENVQPYFILRSSGSDGHRWKFTCDDTGMINLPGEDLGV